MENLTMRRLVAFTGIALLLTTAARADVESGPKVGEKTAELKVFAATGDQAGKELDYARERKEKPTIYVFVQAEQFGRPTARYLKVLDGAVKKAGGDAAIVAVWLTGDVNKSKEYLPKAQQSLQLESTALSVFPGDKSGPNGWGLSDRAFVTTVVAKDEKVAATFAYVSLNETDVRKVVQALQKVLEKK
jgi:hypothetical protein